MAKAWDPFKEISKFQKTLNKKIDVLFAEYKKPFSNIRHSKDFVSVEVKLPGIEKKDKMVIEADHTKLIIGAKNKSGNERYYRVIYLPPGLDIERAKANFKDNLLKIHIPKSRLKRKIKIK